MERIQRILRHSQYGIWLEKNKKAEENRIFCRHDMEHSLAVARIAYILWLEQGGGVKEKPLFYGAALLHDIGKWQKADFPQQDHGVLSASLAEGILADCGFAPEEAEVILGAIVAHSGEANRKVIASKPQKTFAEVFYLADKLSRCCWQCGAKKDCYWQVKNEELEY